MTVAAESPDGGRDQSTTAMNEFLLAAATGDQVAYGRLYDLLAPVVWRVVKGVVRDARLAEDVTQEVFVQLWQNAPKFDPDRGSARAFTLTFAHRRAVDAVRHEQTRRNTADQVIFEEPTAAPVPDAARLALAQLDRVVVRNALNSLTGPQRSCIELAYFGGLSQSQIATKLEIPLGTVKTRVREGLLRLRDTLGASQ